MKGFFNVNRPSDPSSRIISRRHTFWSWSTVVKDLSKETSGSPHVPMQLQKRNPYVSGILPLLPRSIILPPSPSTIIIINTKTASQPLQERVRAGGDTFREHAIFPSVFED
jgi:hypothetical protein